MAKILTYKMKKWLDKKGLNPKEWGYVKNTNEIFVIVNKTTKEKKTFIKDETMDF